MLSALMFLRLAAALVAVLANPAAAAPRLDACRTGHEALLRAAAPIDAPLAQARAAWLDAARLRWAGVNAAADASSRFAFVFSREGRLNVRQGEVVRGADTVLELDTAAEPAPSEAGKRFSHIGAGAVLAVRAADRPKLRQLLRGQSMLVQRDPRGRITNASAVQAAGVLDALYVAAESVPDLGASVRGGRSTFKVWAPTAQSVAVCIDAGTAGAAPRLLPMQRNDRSGVWHTNAAADLTGRHYTYLVDVFVPGRGLVRNRVTDPYSLSLNADSERSVVLDLNASALKPPGWDDTPRPARVAASTDMVVYELHVRDFSIGDASVPAAHRGKYLAFTETASLGMQHLKRLSAAGVTDVHLLPVFDLATVPERGCTTPPASTLSTGAPDSPAQQAAVMAAAATDCFNWGYDPFHFTAPEGSFATDATDGAVRIREFRAMVQALHRAGLRVGMDMVYNHTTASGQAAKSVLDRIVPGYYHRLDANGAVEKSTCCDNTATEHRMMAKLMIDSAVVWARDHKIDSMRFDLMGHQPREAMERLQRAVDAAAGRRIHLLGEGWNYGEVENGKRFVQASQLSLNGSGIGSFSDRARDAVRGGWGGSADEVARTQGFTNGLFSDRNAAAVRAGVGSEDELRRAADLVRVGLAGTLRRFEMTSASGERKRLDAIDYNGQPAGYASEPGEVVNYVENHDNQTLFDNNVIKLPQATSREDRARVQTLAAAVVAFSQGIAYFHAGQEILRSKSLDRNSYDSGDWFNRLDWTLQDNGFGAGLPPERDNKELWPLIQPLLAESSAIKPTRTEITWARDAFLDLLRIRASTPLFRLRSADEVMRRLSFPNTGPQQNASVVVGLLDGEGLAGANFRRALFFINAHPSPQTLTLDVDKTRAWTLHPVHRAPQAADLRPAREFNHDAAGGRFTIPARTALVVVQTDP